MLKIGEFIYPWGSGHYSRMMRLNDALSIQIEDELDVQVLEDSLSLKKPPILTGVETLV